MGIAVVLLGLIASLYGAEGKLSIHRGLAAIGPAPAVYNVIKYGAIGNGQPQTDDEGDDTNSLAFIQAWRAACDSTGVARVLIPQGTFMTGPVLFAGPCKARVTVEIQGTVIANPDITLYSEPEWLMFENINGVTLTGTGVVNGNGPKNWRLNDCPKNTNCAPLPTSIKFHRVTNGVIDGVTSINSMFFHIFVTNCHGVTVQNVKISAPANSPNTDGVHVGGSDMVTITNTKIATGDDCISIGQGSKGVTVTGVTCGPGHGISVGSLGKYTYETPVSGVLVKNCTLIGTTNGARVKSWPGNNVNSATNIIFQDLVMDHVKNPIIIDQQYGRKKAPVQSHVKISDVHFTNIRGTSISMPMASFACSSLFPCTGVTVSNINLQFVGRAGLAARGILGTSSPCMNAQVVFQGAHNGISC